MEYLFYFLCALVLLGFMLFVFGLIDEHESAKEKNIIDKSGVRSGVSYWKHQYELALERSVRLSNQLNASININNSSFEEEKIIKKDIFRLQERINSQLVTEAKLIGLVNGITQDISDAYCDGSDLRLIESVVAKRIFESDVVLY